MDALAEVNPPSKIQTNRMNALAALLLLHYKFCSEIDFKIGPSPIKLYIECTVMLCSDKYNWYFYSDSVITQAIKLYWPKNLVSLI